MIAMAGRGAPCRRTTRSPRSMPYAIPRSVADVRCPVPNARGGWRRATPVSVRLPRLLLHLPPDAHLRPRRLEADHRLRPGRRRQPGYLVDGRRLPVEEVPRDLGLQPGPRQRAEGFRPGAD